MDKPPVKIFISYAHDDSPFFEVFQKTLRTQLKSRKKFDYKLWDDSQIHIGTLWDDEIQKQLQGCDLAILCVSDSFLASDYIKAKEFGALITEFPGTLLAPLLLSPCSFTDWDELSKRQIFMPKGDRYDETTNEDFTFADLVRFNQKNGKLIPNPNIDRYVKHFIEKIEAGIENKPVPTLNKQTITNNHTTKYITNNYPFFERDNFFGRDDLLKQINEKLKTIEVPLLLSGIGGMGKTAVAVAYGKEFFNSYTYIAWINTTEDIFSSLFGTLQGNPILQFQYNTEGEKSKDIFTIMQLLKQVSGTNLLIIDNANDELDLINFLNEWKRYQPSWKCIITTRCENYVYKNHSIKLEIISLNAAEELFKRHNDKTFEKDDFKQIYEYIGGHTFLTELLGKFGQESIGITKTSELLSYLKERGIKALNKSVIAKQGQQLETDKLVSEFVMALYDPLSLPEKEQSFLRYFSILPSTEIEFKKLFYIFTENEGHEQDMEALLSSLVRRGWLIRNKSSFKCHQIIQEICKEKLAPDAENCKVIIYNLLKWFQSTNTTKAAVFFEIGISIVDNINGITFHFAVMQFLFSEKVTETGNLTYGLSLNKNAEKIFSLINEEYNKAICLERMGSIYLMLGKIDEAMEWYLKYNKILKELAEKDPEDIDFKNGLGVSYSKLGEIYKYQGKIDEAMLSYQKDVEISKEISEKNPDNIGLKNALAISYSKLGEIYQVEKKSSDAMKYFLLYYEIEKELHETNPENNRFKNSFAISNMKLGGVYESEGKINNALNYFLLFNKLEKELHETDPENVEFSNNLAISYSRAGRIYKSQGKLNKAILFYQKDMEIAKELFERNQDNVEYGNNLSISYRELGDFYREDNKIESAKECYLKQNNILLEILKKSPQSQKYKRSLANSYLQLALLSTSKEEKGYYIKAKEALIQLVILTPENEDFKKTLEVVVRKISEL